jgi:ribosomal protein S18 acetylase RimI-like enzyme
MKINSNTTDISIKRIKALETYPVRHPVLRKGRPIDTCKMEADDLETTFHFGLFYNSNLVGVATFMIDKDLQFTEEKQYRLRGMAVLKAYQGYHFGKQLLQFGEHYLKTNNVERIWFNARINAVNFYKNNGYKTYGAIFDIPDIGPHYIMSKTL